MLCTNGETLFLTLGIPVVFLLFFSAVHVLPTGTRHPVDFLVPGILALAIMSTAMTALGIGTGFEEQLDQALIVAESGQAEGHFADAVAAGMIRPVFHQRLDPRHGAARDACVQIHCKRENI